PLDDRTLAVLANERRRAVEAGVLAGRIEPHRYGCNVRFGNTECTAGGENRWKQPAADDIHGDAGTLQRRDRFACPGYERVHVPGGERVDGRTARADEL